MPQVFIGLGSNLGDRLDYLHRAVDSLSELECTSVVKCSSVYETQPVGKTNQPDFLNMVVELRSDLNEKGLFNGLKRIEEKIGRKHGERWGPREIDLDLLYYDASVIKDAELSLPHPEIANRKFVLVPMNEIAPEFEDPAKHESIESLLMKCTDKGNVGKIDAGLFVKDKK
jgi:2-amino-4-hydroxy-6-hydroxymethyldihydropteridine diphosphokinase